MKVGIMQPYFLPYLGYWQLMNLVDVYVILDDVNYINRGWIERNRILINDEPHYINVPVFGKSQNKLINELIVNHDVNEIEKNIRKVELAYKKSISYDKIMPMFEQIIQNKEEHLHAFIKNSLLVISEHLDIHCKFLYSSEIDTSKKYKGKDRIIEICKILGATDYFNSIGGQALYNKEEFCNNGISLKFLKMDDIIYHQGTGKFVPYLSILDVLMNCSYDDVLKMLNKYSLV